MNSIWQEETKIFQKLINKIFYTSLKYVKLNPKKFDIDIQLATKSEIQDLNKKHRKIDKATDVLSFPMFDIKPFEKNVHKNLKEAIDPVTKKIMLGDIVICKEVAIENAKNYEHSEQREICYLIVHGIFHLLGFDHMNEDDKRIMRAAEEAVLKKYRIRQ